MNFKISISSKNSSSFVDFGHLDHSLDYQSWIQRSFSFLFHPENYSLSDTVKKYTIVKVEFALVSDFHADTVSEIRAV